MNRRAPLRRCLLPLVASWSAAAALLVVDRPSHALAVTAAGGVIAAAVAAGVPVDRALHRLGTWIGHGAFALLYAVVWVPAWALASVTRRGRARPGEFRPRPGGSTSTPEASYHLGATERSRRGLLATVWQAVGIVVVLAVVNYGIGWGWQRWLDPDRVPAAVPERIGDTSTAALDPRADVPAMSSYPWRDAYFREMSSVKVRYWPYLEYRPVDFSGSYINIDGWTRRSYEPTGSDAAMPTISFFGGSKMWGEGQRDGYTIPSMIARYAEEAGIPVHVDNHGQRGWVNWQEMLLFEQLTADRSSPPDLAVFYDGSNDVNAQLGAFAGGPTTTTAEDLAAIFDAARGGNAGSASASAATGDQEGARSLGSIVGDLLENYREHSAIHRLLGSEAAGAEASSARSAAQVRPPSNRDVPRVIRSTLDVYQRGRDRIDDIAAERGVQPVYFVERQISLRAPQGAPVEAFGRYRQIIDGIADAGPDVHDVAHVLDAHQDTYIDPGHTNEAGAALIARAMFDVLEPTIRAWYRAHG